MCESQSTNNNIDNKYESVEKEYVEYAKSIVIDRIYEAVNKNNVTGEVVLEGYHEGLTLGELCECLHLLELNIQGFRLD